MVFTRQKHKSLQSQYVAEMLHGKLDKLPSIIALQFSESVAKES
jgi:methionine-rich copper-binding protein CopC